MEHADGYCTVHGVIILSIPPNSYTYSR